MKFTPKSLPGNVNVSKTHPIKELFWLAGGMFLLAGSLYFLLGLLADWGVARTSPDIENWLGEQAMQGAGSSGCSGTTEEYLSIMKESGISHAVMANMTPTYDMRMAALEKLPDDMADADRKAAEEEIREKMVSRMQRRNLWTCTMAKENQGLIPLISIDMAVIKMPYQRLQFEASRFLTATEDARNAIP